MFSTLIFAAEEKKSFEEEIQILCQKALASEEDPDDLSHASNPSRERTPITMEDK